MSVLGNSSSRASMPQNWTIETFILGCILFSVAGQHFGHVRKIPCFFLFCFLLPFTYFTNMLRTQ